MPSIQRRTLLKTVGGGFVAGSVALAGCSSSCPDSDQPTPEETLDTGTAPAGPFDSMPGSAWPSLHADAGNTGFTDVTPPGDGSTVRWRTELDLPDADGATLSASSPVVSDGRVFVADAARVHARSLRSGEELWQSTQIDPTGRENYGVAAETAAPTAADGSVYVGTDSGVFAFRADDGTERWHADQLAGAAAPAVVDGVVYAAGDAQVVALDATDGAELWTRSVDWEPTIDPPAVGAGVVVLPTSSGAVALDAATGEPRWRTEDRADTHAVLADGVCLYGNDEGLHAIDVDSGERRWSFDRGDYRALQSPVVTSDTIYVVEQPGEAGAATFALDYTPGEKPSPRWCSAVGEGAVTAATADRAFALISVGEGPDARRGIAAFTADLGQVPWALVARSSPRGWLTPPAVLDGALVATTRGGTLVAASNQGGA